MCVQFVCVRLENVKNNLKVKERIYIKQHRRGTFEMTFIGSIRRKCSKYSFTEVLVLSLHIFNTSLHKLLYITFYLIGNSINPKNSDYLI